MLNFSSILIFSENPKALQEFYEKVFDTKSMMDWEDFRTYQTGTGVISIGPHDKVHGKSANPERIMINFDTEDVKGEFERIKGLGAKVIAEPYKPDGSSDYWIATLADPDGNYFQLMTPMTPERERASSN